VSLGISNIALSQTPEELDHARGQFQEALSLEVAGDYSSALTKLEQVAKVKLTPQVRYHLARCKEYLGRLTEALGDYRVAATEAREFELAEIPEFERALESLEARVPKLRIQLLGAATTAHVELDGVRIGTTVLNELIPVDPGLRSVVLVEANGASEPIQVQAVEGRIVEVQLRSRAVAPREVVEKKLVVSSGVPAWAYVSAGVGTVALASSVALFVVRGQALSDLDRECSNNICSESMRSTWERGKFASLAAPTALAVGVLGIGVAVWGFSSPVKVPAKTASGSRKAVISLNSSPEYVGVRLSGGF
jgi:hypothetical protein